MKTKIKTCIAATLLVALTSCVKNKDLELVRPVNNTTGISAAIVSNNFNWSTTNKIAFRFNANKENNFGLVFKIMLADGSVLFQKLQKANEDLVGEIELPAYNKSVLVAFGSESKTYDCSNGTITIAF